jgi:two-component system capsular synthesis response regulator RcsB
MPKIQINWTEQPMVLNENVDIPRIVLADDHSIVRYGIRMAVESQRIARVVAEAGSPLELLAVLSQTPCDVIVTDFSMPDDHGRDGLSLIEKLIRNFPMTPIIVITALRNVGLLSALLRKGVKGLVEKRGDVMELCLAMQAVTKGREYISQDLLSMLTAADAVPRLQGVRQRDLTNAESEVLRLFAYDGLTSQQISERLNRSRKTISRHKRSALAKLGLSTDQDLLKYCQEVNLRDQ